MKPLDETMRLRVLAQVRSFPPGQLRTAKDIAAGMDGKLTGPDVQPALCVLVVQHLAVDGPEGWGRP